MDNVQTILSLNQKEKIYREMEEVKFSRNDIENILLVMKKEKEKNSSFKKGYLSFLILFIRFAKANQNNCFLASYSFISKYKKTKSKNIDVLKYLNYLESIGYIVHLNSEEKGKGYRITEKNGKLTEINKFFLKLKVDMNTEECIYDIKEIDDFMNHINNFYNKKTNVKYLYRDFKEKYRKLGKYKNNENQWEIELQEIQYVD